MALNDHSVIAIYSAHQIHLERLAMGYGNDAVKTLKKMHSLINAKINAIQRGGKNQKDLFLEIEFILDEHLTTLSDQMKQNILGLFEYELGWNDSALQDITDEQISTKIPALNAAYASAAKIPINVGGRYATYNQLMSGFKGQQKQQIKNAITNGYIYGNTNREIASLILENLDQSLPRSEASARMIARTTTNHMATQARLSFCEKNEDVISTYRSIGTLDGRTSKECRSLDGVEVKRNDPRWANFETPRHLNCRSTIVPIPHAKYRYDDSGATRPERFHKGTKRIDSKTTFYEALQSMPKSTQDEILGKTLGAAFREMKDPDSFARLTIDQKTLKPLTIEQIKSRDNKLSKILRDL